MLRGKIQGVPEWVKDSWCPGLFECVVLCFVTREDNDLAPEVARPKSMEQGAIGRQIR
jgi:hypothetical protein